MFSQIHSALLIILPLLVSTSVLAAPPSSGSVLVRQDSSGTIVSPASGTIINPGDAFDFQYITRADYGITSLNYTVYLMTSSPTSFAPSAEFGTGYYFGRFAEPNYPGNPDPKNLAPTQLVMPDFADSPGGFGAGERISNATFSLVVMEEYVTGAGAVGALMSLASNEILYNATTTST